jgi:hypothetical protein
MCTMVRQRRSSAVETCVGTTREATDVRSAGRRAEALRRDLSCASGAWDGVPDMVHELVATERALDELGGRSISIEGAAQLPRNAHVIVDNPRGGGQRRLLIGATDGGRALTLVIEQTVDLTTWVILTGWSATETERRILNR